MSSALKIVEQSLAAYNAQDMDAMLATYAEDCVIATLNGPAQQNNKAEIRARYTKTFGEFPENHARIVNRIVLGDTVIDHEEVSRGPNGPVFEALCIYTVKDGLIRRVDFA